MSDQPVLSSSQRSLLEANRDRAKFSGHAGGKARGAAGYVSDSDDSCDFLSATGQWAIFNPPQEGGFPDIHIGAAWRPLEREDGGLIGRLLKRRREQNVDLDLGVLYELNNGKRGSIQGFGRVFGRYDAEPFIYLHGDDRSGHDHDDTHHGHDEIITINGQKWEEIRRILVYLYIYGGADHWAEVAPQVQVLVPRERPVVARLHTSRSELCIAAVLKMENVRGGIRMKNITEYYPGHPSMDRAFGFGLEWEDGSKD